ncbi:ferritin-like domain-containing protein [Burkholderia vietnamiensis]|uniref:ferritin-like domain-containing protein n=1 Tax=Burkholderia vietnamiensis TaxID=60552 RepID=UPI00264D1F41|nr:ferritin-like domain-containing protein [Burkholderia vietnamiensis]MDN8036295.1 ferritin-like domain-containing protein [Burkholderia vietnamiensis]
MSDTLQEQHAAADHAMRHWTFESQGPVKIGSDAHKRMFCRMLLDTHNPYKPAVIDWPQLKPDALKRLTSLPIWDIAVQTEGRASVRVATFAATVDDPLLRSALDMDGGEEARHKVVLSKLVAAYGIKLAPEPPYPAPKDAEWSWMVTGFSECIDSFFAFGLFRSAQRSGYFPAELVETFEPVIQEEGRHILFFVNWYAWYWRNLPWWQRPWFFARVAAVWAFLIWERVGIARGIDTDGVAHDANFPATSTAEIGDALDPRELIELCLTENDRRMAGYDERLLRPTFVPRMARLALRFLRK